MQQASVTRGPLTRSTSVDGSGKGAGSSLQRQISLPDYHLPTSYSAGYALEVIQVIVHNNRHKMIYKQKFKLIH